jgi:argininosuccinate lyase
MNNKAWGGRFKKPLDARVEKFNASLPFDQILYSHDILGSQVHATMLAKQGLLTSEEAKAICEALTQIKEAIEKGETVFSEEYEDIHMFVEHILTQKIGEAGKKLHTGRSRNDQVALDLRLYAREQSLHIKTLLSTVCARFEKLSEKHQADLMPGYTHLQQAQPISLGQYFEAYLHMFQRDISRMDDWFKRMNFSPLGAGALAGSRLPLDREFVASELGFDGVIKNTIDAVSDRDYVIELCSIISMIMMHLSRLAEDLIIWATQEFNFLTLDDAFSTGSSLMPNKKNPDVLELMRGKCGRVFGNLFSILTVMKALPLAYNKDMQEDKECLFDSIQTVVSCLDVLDPFMESVSFNTDKMQDVVNSGYLNATKILEDLVLKGIPFREAHHQVGIWVAQAMEKGCRIEDVM